ncbi:uncharacterized protein EI90DRAFT_174779 [Cantharellus anzutake]|uniref:uncharacterized protein n=1 Tax=Cantharellus anzutake TaxID=1750568 RepID=UPI00190820AB|nr:uncharacterized protein EI90DRAFT_174779 [Cantharellus anzutake]KAF8336435.1 hypothetical protein EI90DRAFT_174779 [Cantharellus anzutake]
MSRGTSSNHPEVSLSSLSRIAHVLTPLAQHLPQSRCLATIHCRNSFRITSTNLGSSDNFCPPPHGCVLTHTYFLASPFPDRGKLCAQLHAFTTTTHSNLSFIPHHQTPQRSIPMAMDPPKISLPPPPRRRPSRSNIDSSGKKGLRRTKSTQSMLRSHGSGSPKAWNADPEQVAALHNATIMASGGSPLFPRKTTVSMTGSGSGEGDGTEKPASSSEASTLTPHQGKKPPEGWI